MPLLLGLLLACIQVPALSVYSPSQDTDWARLLPEGSGKAYVVTLCSRCHTLEKIVLQRRSELEWLAIIGKMLGQEDAALSESEVAEVVRYLGTHFKLDEPGGSHGEADQSEAASPPIDWAMLLPEAEGKGRVVAYCSGCHGLKIVVQSRKGWAAWYNNISWMADAFDAPVPEEEIMLLADYLSVHAGEDNPMVRVPLDVNTASMEALQRLPFLTPEHIDELLRHRSEKPFTSIQEFTRVLDLRGSLARLSHVYLTVF
ncbi:helix-hairpin-helix domain-containing protein [Acidobacteria bacterium AH-259-D05]|nr:helix-hairpin-helix domain-containing protein [Acidobacteria bacterium AH-259-D05]